MFLIDCHHGDGGKQESKMDSHEKYGSQINLPNRPKLAEGEEPKLTSEELQRLRQFFDALRSIKIDDEAKDEPNQRE